MKNSTGIERQGLEMTEAGREAMVEGVSQAGIIILMTLAALIGIWGIACLIGGMAGGGVVELLRGWASAVGGVQ